MRIAVISHACVVDLNQRLYEELARHDEMDVLIVAPSTWRASTGKTIEFRPPQPPCESRPLPVWNSGQISLHWYRGLTRALRDWRPDLIYLDEEAYSLPAWQALRICRRMRLPLAFVQTQNIVKRQPWPFAGVERQILDHACLANPITDECADVLRARNFAGQIALIPHCVDTARFFPQPADELRAKLGLRGFVIGYLGRLTEEKGLRELMTAADLLWDQGELDFSVALVGSGPLALELRGWADSKPAGRVVLTGPVTHLQAPDYINLFDLLALPSRTTPGWKEQFGRVIIEAMACGLPVLGSDSGHIPNLIAETGGGVVIAENDALALAAGMRSLIADPAGSREIGEAGRQAVAEKYAVTSVAGRLHDALAMVAGSHYSIAPVL